MFEEIGMLILSWTLHVQNVTWHPITMHNLMHKLKIGKGRKKKVYYIRCVHDTLSVHLEGFSACCKHCLNCSFSWPKGRAQVCLTNCWDKATTFPGVVSVCFRAVGVVHAVTTWWQCEILLCKSKLWKESFEDYMYSVNISSTLEAYFIPIWHINLQFHVS